MIPFEHQKRIIINNRNLLLHHVYSSKMELSEAREGRVQVGLDLEWYKANHDRDIEAYNNYKIENAEYFI